MAAELRFGARKLGSKSLTDTVDDLLASLPVLPLDSEADRTYAEIRLRLERAGTPIGPNDLLIAAHALESGLILVTHNVDEFVRVAGLRVENWLNSSAGLARNSGHRGTWRRAPWGMRDTAERVSRATDVLGGRSYERGQPGVRGAMIRTKGIHPLPPRRSVLTLPDDSTVADDPPLFRRRFVIPSRAAGGSPFSTELRRLLPELPVQGRARILGKSARLRAP